MWISGFLKHKKEKAKSVIQRRNLVFKKIDKKFKLNSSNTFKKVKSVIQINETHKTLIGAFKRIILKKG
jgi:hypothetical protein